MPASSSVAASAACPNCGLRREPGKRRTSTRVWTPTSRRQSTSSPAGRVPWPIVKDLVSSGDVHRQHYNVTFALLALGAIAYALMQSMVAPALLTIQHDLNTTTAGA